MNKKNLFQLVTFMMMICLCGFTSSCGKDDNNEQPESQRADPQQITEDPDGTVELSMSVDGNTLDDLIKIDKDRNFVPASTMNDICFASTGKVYGLGNVNYIPTTGWATKVAIREGNGYVAYHQRTNRFYRMYVEPIETIVEGSHDSGYNTDGGYYQTETTTSKNFFIVKYQKPFKGTDEEIVVPSETMAFKAEGGTQALTFSNKNIVPFTFKSSESWCLVKTSSTNDYNIPDGIAVTVDATTSNKQETATVTITTLFGKEKVITVTRAATGTIITPYRNFGTQSFTAMNNEPHLLYFYSNAEQDGINVSSNESWCKVKMNDITQSGTQQARQVKYIGMKRAESYDVNNIHNYQLEVVVDDNVSDQERKAEITLQSKDGNASCVIPVIQNGLSFRLDKTDMQVNASATKSTIEIIGDVPTNLLEVSSNVSWCKTSIIDANTNPDLGKQRFLQCEIEANVSENSRTAIVTIKMKKSNNVRTLNITQEGLSLSVSNKKISFDRNSNYTTVTVSSNYSGWTPVSSDDSWCKLSWTSNSLTIRVDPTTENREATISFNGFKEKITVKQNRYAIGDSFDEDNLSGTVVYISFDKNLIYKNVGSHQWSTENVPTGATSKDDGKYNTDVIKKIPDFEKNYPAFAACEDLNVNGVTGWYLPAIHENYMCDIRNVWSSTEGSASESYYDCYRDYYNYDGDYYYKYFSSKKTRTYTVYAAHLFE